MMLQYYFTGEVHDIECKPHGNSKRTTPYKRTRASTLSRLKTVCKDHLPSEACAIVEKEVGGIMNSECSGSLPRNVTFVGNCLIKRMKWLH